MHAYLNIIVLTPSEWLHTYSANKSFKNLTLIIYTYERQEVWVKQVRQGEYRPSQCFKWLKCEALKWETIRIAELLQTGSTAISP